MSAIENVCCALLDCGYLDIQILEDVEYDLGEIVEELLANDIKPTLNIITGEIFRKGIEEMEDAVRQAMQNVADNQLIEYDDEEYEKLEEQFDELESLNPKEDIEYFCNCLNTSIYFVNNEEIYRKYLLDEISAIEDNMGFEF